MACRLVAGVGAAGRGVARKVRDAGRPARPIKRKGSVSGGAGFGVARSVRVAANVKAMEMHQGRRPVYGGAPRTGV